MVGERDRRAPPQPQPLVPRQRDRAVLLREPWRTLDAAEEQPSHGSGGRHRRAPAGERPDPRNARPQHLDHAGHHAAGTALRRAAGHLWPPVPRQTRHHVLPHGRVAVQRWQVHGTESAARRSHSLLPRRQPRRGSRRDRRDRDRWAEREFVLARRSRWRGSEHRDRGCRRRDGS